MQLDALCGSFNVRVLALADDMTGALEVGAKFSGAGIDTIVSAKPVAAGSATVVVLDTETRHVDSETACREVMRFVEQSVTRQPRLIYKKTDSTLRGNIAAELRGLARLYPHWCIGYAPAYPALGRTVTGGVLYVHGRPVSETEFARDELNPVASSSVAAALDLNLDCTVFDGETDLHLTDAARSILSNEKMRIAVGPAGLAEAIAESIDLPRRLLPIQPSIRTCLIMNGSRHERSAKQVRAFAAAGWRVLSSAPEPGLTAEQVALQNARQLLAQTAVESPDAVFVIGGDTAFAFVRELGLPLMQPVGEIVPGVPVTRIAGRDLVLITKAGGFGEDDLLARVHARLNHAE